ncbi:response regulator [Dactylosporangium sucinum]|uniref:Transcriptional regulator, LuxR family protein n=1 Tax=Dactylosporangium sucinum TaxID=1424081 RepID=A0A917UCU6_9ACTN|nr:response regulator transcription factor [Dactylosporangium sucinum]GGM83410.1 putative transcriptional regulator, LuxR family protein [Dactylosporangium sucinum]
MEQTERTRVFVVDDHAVTRYGVVALLEREPDLEVVGEASSVREAMDQVPVAHPDVAVLDVRLPDGSGIELCRDLRAKLPELRCLMLTSFADHEALFDAIMAGADGFTLKESMASDVVASIRTIGAGGSLLDPQTTTALLRWLHGRQEQTDPVHRLNERERTVLELIGEGLTNRQIAERLSIAESTVKGHVTKLLAKLDMQRRTQAAAFAARLR